MTDDEFRAIMSLLMCSDPSPVSEEQDHLLRLFADREAQKRGFQTWIEAYMESPKPGDKIARNPKNHNDQWLVAADYFADNFEPIKRAKKRSRKS